MKPDPMTVALSVTLGFRRSSEEGRVAQSDDQREQWIREDTRLMVNVTKWHVQVFRKDSLYINERVSAVQPNHLNSRWKSYKGDRVTTKTKG